MDYNHSFDSRGEHDSGYFTPSPDKDNKLTDAAYKKLELNSNIKKAITNSYTSLNETTNTTAITTNTNNHNTMNLITNSNPVTNLISNNSGVHAALNDVDRPPHSYIALISMAILSKPERKILLNEIYDWVIQNFPYYQYRTDKSWRNSIRHNLSLNECFIKVGKAGNGRGYYWSIHGANMVDFKKGDFRRRQARLRAKHDKATSGSKSSETKSSKPSKSQQNQQQGHQDLMNNLQQQQTSANIASNSSPSSSYQKSFSNPSINNSQTNLAGYYHPQGVNNYHQQQVGNNALNLNTSQDYSNGLSPNGQLHHTYATTTAGSYHNMYQSKPTTQQLASFNYNTHESTSQYNQSYDDLNSTYTSQYNRSSDMSSHNLAEASTPDAKFIIPNNSGLLTNAANINISNKLHSGSQSTSPSSSTSSTSSHLSSTNPNNYFSYQNSYVHNQGGGVGINQQNGQHTGGYNQYLSSTFPWLPTGGNVVTGGSGSSFLETLTSAAQQQGQSTSVPSYDLNTFPYHNSQVNRI